MDHAGHFMEGDGARRRIVGPEFGAPTWCSRADWRRGFRRADHLHFGRRSWLRFPVNWVASACWRMFPSWRRPEIRSAGNLFVMLANRISGS